MTPKDEEQLRNTTYIKVLPAIIQGLCASKRWSGESAATIADHADDIAIELADKAVRSFKASADMREDDETDLQSNPDQKDDPETNARILDKILPPLPPLSHESCTGKVFCDCPTCRKERT